MVEIGLTARDRQLAKLPLRFGGLGLLSHRDCAEPAVQAARSASDRVLEEVLPLLDTPPTDSAPTQRQLCSELRGTQQEALVSTLEPREAMLSADNQSKLFRYWMTALPRTNFQTLGGKDMAVGMCYRTLRHSHLDSCRECYQVNHLGHDEVCTDRPKFYTLRHESIKRALSYHLAQVPGTQVKVEWKQRDPITNRPTAGDLRTDLLVTGKASYQQEASEFDLSVRSLYTTAVAYDRPPFLGTAGSPAPSLQILTNKLREVLDKHAADKVCKYQAVCRNAFFPLILSVGGGTLATDTEPVFAHWKSTMGRLRYRYMTTDISVSLIRAKAAAFIL